MSRQRVLVVGAGIGGIATASMLAKAGYAVTVLEKRSQLGGRAGSFSAQGFTFDTGPSWFLMPEVFEHYFQLFDVDMRQALDLRRLDPAYKVFYEDDGVLPLAIHGDLERDKATFEAVEPGAGQALDRYLKAAGRTYEVAAGNFLYTDFQHPVGLLKAGMLPLVPQLLSSAIQPIDHYVGKYFKHPALRQIMEYPMVFLGTSPYQAPALYHLMSHMDFTQGVFYPQGGLYEVIKLMRSIAEDVGVRFETGCEVVGFDVDAGRVAGVRLASGERREADIVVSNADLQHTETNLVPEAWRSYPERYWAKRQVGPSALLMYLGVKGALPQLEHHNLLFTRDWQANFKAIFNDKTWPQPASIYICKPSTTDPSVAPEGHENLFALVPMQADPTVSGAELEAHAGLYLAQIADMAGIPDLQERIVYQRYFGPADFASEFNSWQGSALGMSHLLSQSAMFRPGVQSRKLENLYYAGAGTRPGIGLPMCLIGAEVVYKRLAGDTSGTPIARISRLEAAG